MSNSNGKGNKELILKPKGFSPYPFPKREKTRKEKIRGDKIRALFITPVTLKELIGYNRGYRKETEHESSLEANMDQNLPCRVLRRQYPVSAGIG